LDVAIASEARFRLGPDARPVSDIGTRGYFFWKRYLDVFDTVTVLARLSRETMATGEPVEGPSVSLVPLTNYTGIGQYSTVRGKLRRQIRRALSRESALILRLPGRIGSLAWREVSRSGHPYGVEVVGDPFSVFGRGGANYALSPILRRWCMYELRRQCLRACAVAYVTESTLQQRYPPGKAAFCTHYSSVDLPESALVEKPRDGRIGETVDIVSIGTLEQLYKGPDTLLEAVAVCRTAGLDVRLTWIGDGRHRRALNQKADLLGISESVHFVGSLPAGDAIRGELDRADLFVLPSRAEGLPRAMIEAMARGIPCIGTAMGGIPELLQPSDLVKPDDAEALARKIVDVVSDRERMISMSRRNLLRARSYRETILVARRREFYRQVREKTTHAMGL